MDGQVKKEETGGRLFMDGTKLDRHLDEVVKWQKGEWFAPLHMEISLTNVCNQKCKFCYTIWTHGKDMMSEQMACDLIRSGKRAGMKSALIAGEGEPTANPAYVTAIETAGEVGLDMALNTNAINIKEADLYRILPHLSWVRFSFQGSTPELYSSIHQVPVQQYHKAVANIRRAAEIKKELGLSVTLGMQQVLIVDNGHDVYNTAVLAKSLGVDYYVIKPCHPHENSGFSTVADLVNTHRETLQKATTLSDGKFSAIVRWNFLAEAEAPRSYNRCLGLPFIIQITSNGGVMTCYPRSDQPGHQYGSLQESSLEEILRSDKFRETYKWVEHNVNVHKCMPTCRQHNVNKYLWWLSEEQPTHFNFI